MAWIHGLLEASRFSFVSSAVYVLWDVYSVPIMKAVEEGLCSCRIVSAGQLACKVDRRFSYPGLCLLPLGLASANVCTVVL